MNKQIFPIEDVDQFIRSFLEPPQYLTLSALNVHYNQLLSDDISNINFVQKNMEKAISRGSVHIAKWIYKSIAESCGNLQTFTDILSKITVL